MISTGRESCQRPLRVLVDAHMIGQRETGNETYVTNLLSQLARLPEVRCGAVIRPDVSLPRSLAEAKIDWLVLRSNGNWRRVFYALGRFCQDWGADILHTTYVGPVFLPCCHVTSVHDVSFKRYPGCFSLRDRLLFATLLPLTLRCVDGVLTLSEHAKRELLYFYPFLAGKVYATPLAASEFFFPVKDRAALVGVKERYGIAGRFVLAVGNLQPRKNLDRLVQAFSVIITQMPELYLVIVGKAHWGSSRVFSLVRALGLERRVVFTGYVPDEDLRVLYSAADVFVYPLLYEGFGLPVLEAMACGAPVVTSNTSSMPEVAGNAAILVDPRNVNAIAEAILSVLSNTTRARDLSERGLERARMFSWKQTARQTWEIYQSIIQSKKA